MSESPAEFLARMLDRDEAAARAATPGPWRYDPAKEWHTPDELDKPDGEWMRGQEFVGAGDPFEAIGVATAGPAGDPVSMADAAHIAAWDPARVLAECAAKREVLTLHPSRPTVWVEDEEAQSCKSCSGGDRCEVPYPCGTIRALLRPYAGEPGFNPTWLED